MAQQTTPLCLSITELDPAYGVYTLSTAAKVLSELQAGRQSREIIVSWWLAPADCGGEVHVTLRGKVEYRTQWQLQAYLDYVQSRICDMMDERKVRFCLRVESCQENGG